MIVREEANMAERNHGCPHATVLRYKLEITVDTQDRLSLRWTIMNDKHGQRCMCRYKKHITQQMHQLIKVVVVQ